MGTVQNEVDERSNLARTNKFELLLFRLGSRTPDEESELFGINVFKVREIAVMPPVTKVGGAPANVLGLANMRGQIIQVLDLPSIAGLKPKSGLHIMLVTEFARTTQGFAIEGVEEITRLDWNDVISAAPGTGGSLLTSIARLPEHDGQKERLVQILDVETILREIPGMQQDQMDRRVGEPIRLLPGAALLVADDSIVARSLIEQTLRALSIPYLMTTSGREAWNRLNAIADAAERDGAKVSDKVALVLTDLEMPEMDGFTLTRKVKADARFDAIPVVIHSSLSGTTNEEHVRRVGADAYVAKFSAEELSRTLRSLLPG